jgi:cytosine/uracil/thiamine/allantoin permease
MDNLAKWIILAGAGLIVLGMLVWLLTKAGLPIGQMPGDISAKGENWGFYFPVVSGIVISIILTVVINVLIWLFRK